MSRPVRSLLVGIGLAAAVAAGLVLTTGSASPAVAPFSLPALAGGPPVTVPVVRDGMRLPVVVTFFASWCGPCQGELPKVAQVADQLQAAGARVAFVGVDGNDDHGSGLAFAQRAGVRFPIGADDASVVAPRFDIPGYPATVFIDASGVVVDVVRGPVSPTTLRTWAARIALRH